MNRFALATPTLVLIIPSAASTSGDGSCRSTAVLAGSWRDEPTVALCGDTT